MKTDFTKLRRELDDAITYADFTAARKLAQHGLERAQFEELLGEIMYFKAQMFIIEEDFKMALACLDLALRHNSADGAAYNDRALCMIELSGNEQKALADFDRGIEVEPDYAGVYHNKGWYLNKLGRHDEAITNFEKALKLEPDRAVTYENLADAYLHLGRIQEAVAAFQKALQCLKPEYVDIREQIEVRIEMLRK